MDSDLNAFRTTGPSTVTPVSSIKINVQRMPAHVFREIENVVPPCRPQAEKPELDEMKYYNILVFDIEKNTMGKSAEVCQIAVTDNLVQTHFTSIFYQQKK